jgi:hypothetical protein
MRDLNRQSVEKIFEQELSAVLLQSIKLADRENKPEAKDAFHIILRVIEDRRISREKARADEPRF